MKGLLAALLVLFAPSAFASTATTTNCQTVSDGQLKSALDLPAYTDELRIKPVTHGGQLRLDVRFQLPEMDPLWTCLTWSAELILPPCYVGRDSWTDPDDLAHTITPGASTSLTGPATAHWLVEALEVEYQQTEDNVCRWGNRRHYASPVSKGWIKVQVFEPGSERPKFVDGKDHVAYPIRFVTVRD